MIFKESLKESGRESEQYLSDPKYSLFFSPQIMLEMARIYSIFRYLNHFQISSYISHISLFQFSNSQITSGIEVKGKLFNII